MNSQQRNNRELVRDGGAEAGSQIEQVRDGLVVAHPEIGARRPIYRLCGRQTLLDLLQRADCERKEELQGLLEQKPVSEFTHRNRIQAFIRGRLLRNKIVIANERPSSMAASELGLLRQRHTVSGLSCLAGSLVEQLWNFAWPAAIALIHRSFLPVEVIGFFTKLGVIVGGPLVGKLMDYFPRVHAYNCLTVIQVAAQLLSAGMIIHAHTIHPNYVSSVLVRPWFAVLVITLAVERLSGLALGVAMERDWVVLLAGTNRPIALAQANAILSRIDLPCEMAGASLFGIFLSKYETVMCLKLAARLMMWSLPVLVVLTWLTSMLSAGVLGHAKCPHTDFGCLSTGSIHDAEKIFTTSIEATKHGWFEYIQQPVLPASLAYVLLYFNVALAPGGLMTAFLTQHVPICQLYFKPQLLNMTRFIPPSLLHLSNFSITPDYQQHTK
ncbi:hypothetical protein ACS0TY_028185 [Phlomoides rotata]